ncbi:MAG TPA: long-chain fatty acid--CoA ligase [Herpetosiphonaceae bacterium]
MDEQNLAQVFRNRSTQYADLTRWRQSRKGSWITATFKENQLQANQIMAGLRELGAARGDRIGILSNTSCEWLTADWAIMSMGCATVTIYPTLLPATVAYIVNDSELRFLFVENAALLASLDGVQGQLERVERFIVFDGDGLPDDPRVMSWEALRTLSKATPTQQDAQAASDAASIGREDLATIVYTSGTTGEPKGAMLAHRCFLSELAAVRVRVPEFEPGKSDLLFLPTAHILARVQHMVGMDRGMTTAITESAKTVIEDVQAVKPEFFFSVPRIYEKIFSTVRAKAEAKPASKKIFQWALGVGREVSRAKQRGEQPSTLLRAQYKLADRLIYKKVRAVLGGNIRFAITGGAPLDLEILEFFHGMGILLMEAWGLTETTAAATANGNGEYRLGTVGKALPGVEIKLAEDGEILLRGGIVMTGYYNNAKATRETMADGWFHTGDIGELDRDGYLKIVDRKKDLLITAAGKNIAPQAVEAAFKNSPYISQCAVYGDRKPYLVALLTLDPEALGSWADTNGLNLNGDSSQHEKVRELIADEVRQANAGLAQFERVKYYEILPEDFTVDNGLLTPTLKLRRRHIYDQFKPTFEGLYQGKAD